MSLGAALIVCVVLVWLLFNRVGQMFALVLVGLFVVFALSACEPSSPAVVLECNVERVAGTFRTTDREFERARGGHVLMHRGGRSFYWPVERVTACRTVE